MSRSIVFIVVLTFAVMAFATAVAAFSGLLIAG